MIQSNTLIVSARLRIRRHRFTRQAILILILILSLTFSLLFLAAPVKASSTAPSEAQSPQDTVVSWSDPGPMDPAAWPTVEQIRAKAYVVIDRTSQTVLLGQNETNVLYPASTTKIMTALLALENLPLDQTLTVSATALDLPSDAARAGLVEGEIVTVRDALAAMMLRSGNEAANMVAEAVSGSQLLFAARMNFKARLLGLQLTHFENAHGLQDRQHVTTALDIARLAAVAMENQDFRDLVRTPVYALPATNKHPFNGWNIMTNTNLRLLLGESANYQSEYLTEVTGIKTGTTKAAGQCLVSSAITRSGHEVIAVLLGVSGQDPDGNLVIYSRALLEAGARQVETTGLPAEFPAVASEADAAQNPLQPDEKENPQDTPNLPVSLSAEGLSLLSPVFLAWSKYPVWQLATIGVVIVILILASWLFGYLAGRRSWLRK